MNLLTETGLKRKNRLEVEKKDPETGTGNRCFGKRRQRKLAYGTVAVIMMRM
jgi:hypothetical protein